MAAHRTTTDPSVDLLSGLSQQSRDAPTKIFRVLAEVGTPLPTREVEERTGYGIRYGQLYVSVFVRNLHTATATAIRRRWHIVAGQGVGLAIAQANDCGIPTVRWPHGRPLEMSKLCRPSQAPRGRRRDELDPSCRAKPETSHVRKDGT